MAASVQMSQPNLADIVKGIKPGAPRTAEVEPPKVAEPASPAPPAPVEEKVKEAAVKELEQTAKDTVPTDKTLETKPDGPKIFDKKNFVEAPLPKTNPWLKKKQPSTPAPSPAPIVPPTPAAAPPPVPAPAPAPVAVAPVPPTKGR